MHSRHSGTTSAALPIAAIPFYIVVMTAVTVALLLFSCSAPSERQARAAVQSFVEAVRQGDMDRVSSIAPFMKELEVEKREKLRKNFQDFEEWSIGEVRIQGRKARVTAHFSSTENSIDIVFPLRAEGDRWMLEEKLRYRTTIDVIPAE